MRAIMRDPGLNPTAHAAAVAQRASQTGRAEIALARARAAMRHRDPLAAEAAHRAFVAAMSVALLTMFARATGAMLHAAWRNFCRHRAEGLSVKDLGP
jgi:hypothetical protein